MPIPDFLKQYSTKKWKAPARKKWGSPQYAEPYEFIKKIKEPKGAPYTDADISNFWNGLTYKRISGSTYSDDEIKNFYEMTSKERPRFKDTSIGAPYKPKALNLDANVMTGLGTLAGISSNRLDYYYSVGTMFTGRDLTGIKLTGNAKSTAIAIGSFVTDQYPRFIHILSLMGKEMELEGLTNIVDDKMPEDLLTGLGSWFIDHPGQLNIAVDPWKERPEAKQERMEKLKEEISIGRERVYAEEEQAAAKFKSIDPGTEFGYQLGSGAASLITALGVTVITKCPHAASLLFGAYQMANVYEQARRTGVEPTEAITKYALPAGIMEGALEYVGLDAFFRAGGGPLLKYAVRTMTEASQEFSQELAGEMITMRLSPEQWEDAREGWDIALKNSLVSAFFGAILGGGASVVGDIAHIPLKIYADNNGFSEKAITAAHENNVARVGKLVEGIGVFGIKKKITKDTATKSIKNITKIVGEEGKKINTRIKPAKPKKTTKPKVVKPEVKPVEKPVEKTKIEEMPIEERPYKSGDELFTAALDYLGTSKRGAKKLKPKEQNIHDLAVAYEVMEGAKKISYEAGFRAGQKFSDLVKKIKAEGYVIDNAAVSEYIKKHPKMKEVKESLEIIKAGLKPTEHWERRKQIRVGEKEKVKTPTKPKTTKQKAAAKKLVQSFSPEIKKILDKIVVVQEGDKVYAGGLTKSDTKKLFKLNIVDKEGNLTTKGQALKESKIAKVTPEKVSKIKKPVVEKEKKVTKPKAEKKPAKVKPSEKLEKIRIQQDMKTQDKDVFVLIGKKSESNKFIKVYGNYLYEILGIRSQYRQKQITEAEYVAGIKKVLAEFKEYDKLSSKEKKKLEKEQRAKDTREMEQDETVEVIPGVEQKAEGIKKEDIEQSLEDVIGIERKEVAGEWATKINRIPVSTHSGQWANIKKIAKQIKSKKLTREDKVDILTISKAVEEENLAKDLADKDSWDREIEQEDIVYPKRLTIRELKNDRYSLGKQVVQKGDDLYSIIKRTKQAIDDKNLTGHDKTAQLESLYSDLVKQESRVSDKYNVQNNIDILTTRVKEVFATFDRAVKTFKESKQEGKERERIDRAYLVALNDFNSVLGFAITTNTFFSHKSIVKAIKQLGTTYKAAVKSSKTVFTINLGDKKKGLIESLIEKENDLKIRMKLYAKDKGFVEANLDEKEIGKEKPKGGRKGFVEIDIATGTAAAKGIRGFVDTMWKGIKHSLIAYESIKDKNVEVYEHIKKVSAKLLGAAEVAGKTIREELNGATLHNETQVLMARAWEENIPLRKLLKVGEGGIKNAEELKSAFVIYEAISKLLKANEDAKILHKIIKNRKVHQFAALKEINKKIKKVQKKEAKGYEKELKKLEAAKKRIKKMRYLPHSGIVEAIKRVEREADKTGEKMPGYVSKRRPESLNLEFKHRTGTETIYTLYENGIITVRDASLITLAFKDTFNTLAKSAMREFIDSEIEAKRIVTAKKGSKKWLLLRARGYMTAKEIGLVDETLKDKLFHKVTAAALVSLEKETTSKKDSFDAIIKYFNIIKVAQFIKPQIIWYYDLIQKTFGGVWSFNPAKEFMRYKETLEVLMGSTEEGRKTYNFLIQSGLYGGSEGKSDVAVKRYAEGVHTMASSDRAKLTRVLSRMAGGKSLGKGDMSITDAITFVSDVFAGFTWTGDRFFRTQGYLTLRAMGYSQEQAAKEAKFVYGNYNLLSKKYKKFGSIAFFVYAFRILMPIQLAKTVAHPIIDIVTLMNPHKKNPLKARWEKDMKGLLGLLLIPFIFDKLMKRAGFKPEGKHLGFVAWKYKKTITVDGEEREVIVATNNIINMPVKYLNRLSYYDPTSMDPRYTQILMNTFKWEIHPFFRILIDCAQNRPSFGNKKFIYVPGDNQGKIALDMTAYFLGQSFRFWGTLAELGQPRNKEQRAAIKGSMDAFTSLMTDMFGYSYTRMTLAERRRIGLRALMRAFDEKKYNYDDLLKEGYYTAEKYDAKIETLKRWYTTTKEIMSTQK